MTNSRTQSHDKSKIQKEKKSKKFKNTENSHYWTSFFFDQRYWNLKDSNNEY